MRTRTVVIGIAIAVLALASLAGFAAVKLWDEYRPGSAIERAFFYAKPISREELKGFGDELVPRLREIANSSKAESISHRAYDHLAKRSQSESNMLLVQILSGATRVDPDNALFQFNIGVTTHGTPPSIFKDRGFRQAVVAMADSESAHTRAVVAEYIGDLNWEEDVPKLRELIHDPDLDVRETAAESLEDLTGEVVEIKRPKASFPSVALRKDLLANYRFIGPSAGNRLVETSYVKWFDGLPCRAVTQGEELVALDSKDNEISRFGFQTSARGCRSLTLPDGSVQLLVETSFGHSVTAFSEGRRKLWTLRGSLEEVAILYSEDGANGLVIDGDGPVLDGLDLSGERQWGVEFGHVLYGLNSHPELPNLFLAVGGGAAVYRVNDHRASQVLSLKPTGIYLGSGLLLPDTNGEPCIIIEGERHDDSVPLVMGFNLKGKRLWQSELPAAVRAVVAVEPAGSEKMVALLTDIGLLFVFDTEGTLRFETQIPRVESDKEYFLVGLAAGPERNGAWTLAVTDSEGSHLFEINP